ncbi:MAG: sensor histidine kinase [Coprococcus sp.]
MRRWYTYLLSYIKNRWFSLAILILWQSILYVSLYLEGVNPGFMIYPVILSIAAMMVYVIFDFCRIRRKDKILNETKQNIDITMENLPKAENIIEQDYQELISHLQQSKRQEHKEQMQKNTELTEFVTLWTHQVKTPLTALSLEVSGMETPKKTECAERLFEIEQYCDIILQYLRVEGNGSDLMIAKYPVKSMVNQAVKYFARSFIGKGLYVKIDIPEERVLVTDEKWLVFVLKQILSNALKYTSEGGITIDMPNENTIRISDTGIGIMKEDIPRIMERGYTGYNGRIDKRATGIGLFLVDSIVKKLGSSVEITSEPGTGTDVYLTIL